MFRRITEFTARLAIRLCNWQADRCYTSLQGLLNDTMRHGQMDEIDEVTAIDLSRSHRWWVSCAEGWKDYLERLSERKVAA